MGAGGVGSAFCAIAARRDFFEQIVVADYDLANVGAYGADPADVPLIPFRHAPYLEKAAAEAPALEDRPIDLLFFGSMLLPDTPNSLVARGLASEGREVLQRIRGTEAVDAEFEDIVRAVEVNKTAPNSYQAIIKRRYWPQLTISILLPLFQQFSGINAVVSLNEGKQGVVSL